MLYSMFLLIIHLKYSSVYMSIPMDSYRSQLREEVQDSTLKDKEGMAAHLAGKSHEQRSLVDRGPQGHRELDTTEAT